MSETLLSVLDRIEAAGDLARGDLLFEVVDGREVAKPVMGAFAYLIAGIVNLELGIYAKQHQLGRVVPEALFRLNPAGKQMRRPDVAFVSYQRWPRDRRVTSAQSWDVVPDLVVEVVSPTDFAGDVLAKVREYLRMGVAQVWVVYPNVREVHVYGPALGVRTFCQNDALEGGDLLPGFRLSLDELFRDGATDQVV